MDEKNWKRMFDSIQNGEDSTCIQFLLDAGLDVNTLNLNNDGKTTLSGYIHLCLSYAAGCGNSEKIMDEKEWKEMFASIWKKEGDTFIQFLLDVGLDVNSSNKHGKTMLSYATECCNLDTIEFLVQKGGDCNVTNSDGSKPLHIAAEYGRMDIVKFFLNLGVFVDCRDNDYCTPLHYVAAKTNIEVGARESYQELVRFLVDSNADFNADNRNGWTPLLLAAQNSLEDIAELFIELGANVDCCNMNEWTVLHICSWNGWSGIVQMLVEGRFDIDLNARTSEGFTPLCIAADASHADVVKLIIKSGANVECRGFMNRTVLHVACQKGWLDVVESLVAIGCDVNAKDCNGDTPLVLAAKEDHSSVVEYLIESGADVQCCDEDGSTVLHHASQDGWSDLMKSLVSKGCDNAKASGGDTPSLFAAFQHPSVMEYIVCGADFECHRESGDSVLHTVSAFGYLNAVKSLVSKGCDLNAKDRNGLTALIRAAVCHNRDVVEYLIDSGADLECCDEHGKTLLHLACQKGWLDTVKSLVRKGCNLNARDNCGHTPLHFYIITKCHIEIIEHLLKAGADCNVENFIGIMATQPDTGIPGVPTLRLEVIKLFIENGVYFWPGDYVEIHMKPFLKKGILQNVEVCTRAVVNKFNNADLPNIYEIPAISECVPPIEKLKIVNNTKVADDIAQSVLYEIQSEGHCNVLNVRLILKCLCVRSIVEYYDGKQVI